MKLALAYVGCFALTVLLVGGSAALLIYARWSEEP